MDVIVCSCKRHSDVGGIDFFDECVCTINGEKKEFPEIEIESGISFV